LRAWILPRLPTRTSRFWHSVVGSQSVFESEAKGSAAILAQRLGAGSVVARANTKTRGHVTIEAIKAAIQSAGANKKLTCSDRAAN
jgi:hypothetical protein